MSTQYKKQKQYGVTVFFPNNSAYPLKYKRVTNFYTLVYFLNNNYPNWQYMNIYTERPNPVYLCRAYANNDILRQTAHLQ